MAETLLHDDNQTVRRLDSVACLIDWLRGMPEPKRTRFLTVLAHCSEGVKDHIFASVSKLKDQSSSPGDRQQALTSISQTLFPNPDEGAGLRASETQQESFARRLREIMAANHISQEELADRAGCSQPAISQLLNRKSRPQKKTILKLADALRVSATDLWPDMQTVEMLDAVAEFQQDGYVLSEAEADALSETAERNPPKIPITLLPKRRR